MCHHRWLFSVFPEEPCHQAPVLTYSCCLVNGTRGSCAPHVWLNVCEQRLQCLYSSPSPERDVLLKSGEALSVIKLDWLLSYRGLRWFSYLLQVALKLLPLAVFSWSTDLTIRYTCLTPSGNPHGDHLEAGVYVQSIVGALSGRCCWEYVSWMVCELEWVTSRLKSGIEGGCFCVL